MITPKSRLLKCTITLLLCVFFYFILFVTILPRSGTVFIPHEGLYKGQLRGYTFHGYGIFESTEIGGTSYEGYWRNGQFHGQGTLSFANGTKLRGEFVEGRITGSAVIIHSDGTEKSLNYEWFFVGGVIWEWVNVGYGEWLPLLWILEGIWNINNVTEVLAAVIMVINF